MKFDSARPPHRYHDPYEQNAKKKSSSQFRAIWFLPHRIEGSPRALSSTSEGFGLCEEGQWLDAKGVCLELHHQIVGNMNSWLHNVPSWSDCCH